MSTLDLTPHFAFVRSSEATDPALAATQLEVVDWLDATLLGHREAVAGVRESRHLTPEGKRGQIDNLTKQVAAHLQTVQPRLDGLRRGVELASFVLTPQARHRLPPDLAAEDARALESEIRSRWQHLDPAERDRAYLEECEKNNVVAVRALERSADTLGLISDEARHRGAELHAAALYPDEYGKLTEIRAVVASLEADFNRACVVAGAQVGEALVGIQVPA